MAPINRSIFKSESSRIISSVFRSAYKNSSVKVIIIYNRYENDNVTRCGPVRRGRTFGGCGIGLGGIGFLGREFDEQLGHVDFDGRR